MYSKLLLHFSRLNMSPNSRGQLHYWHLTKFASQFNKKWIWRFCFEKNKHHVVSHLSPAYLRRWSTLQRSVPFKIVFIISILNFIINFFYYLSKQSLLKFLLSSRICSFYVVQFKILIKITIVKQLLTIDKLGKFIVLWFYLEVVKIFKFVLVFPAIMIINLWL